MKKQNKRDQFLLHILEPQLLFRYLPLQTGYGDIRCYVTDFNANPAGSAQRTHAANKDAYRN